ncbi:MAG TPA: hypothetical protein VIG72_15125, partial [Pontibacter sp.]
MSITLRHTPARVLAIVILGGALLTGCQHEEEQQTSKTIAETLVATADTVQRRPAPEFYVIPPGTERTRVWVCDDSLSDVFHTDNTCKLLLTCKAAYKNVSLQRAIEEYGR